MKLLLKMIARSRIATGIQSNRERCDQLFDRVLMEFAAHALGYLNAGQFSHS
jgi:hypothetical protein